MADILNFPRKIRELGLFPFGSVSVDPPPVNAGLIEDLKCGQWTTRKLKIPTSLSGYIIMECFESADGKRLKGSSTMEPDFRLSSLRLSVKNAFAYDKLSLFMYDDYGYPETDFMSHVVNYPLGGGLEVLFNLKIMQSTVQYTLYF